MKINLVVMFGGVSCEHDISIITALQAIKNINTTKYNIIPVYITKSGQWLSGKDLLNMDYYINPTQKKYKVFPVTILPNSSYLYKITKVGVYKWQEVNVALLSLHGTNGEDGAIPALFQLNNIPYTSCSMFSSSLCCDKVSFKYYIKGLGLKTADFLTYHESQFNNNSQFVVNEIIEKLDFPVIVKPSKLGSSIGITVCYNEKELYAGLDLGFSLGEQVLVEKYLTDISEINCAILGLNDEFVVSELEEPIKTNKILSFENKYINSQKNGDMSFISRKMPPNISQELYDEVVNTSKFLFEKLNLKGVIRIDYIVKDGELLVNEINTIPGSFANYLFKPKGISFATLIDKLVTIAFNESILKQQKIKTFQSDVLKNINLNGLKK